MKRLDQYLVEFGWARSRQSAQEKIEKGFIEIKQKGVDEGWKPIQKASFRFDSETMELRQKENPLDRYVSRAGLKLEGALEHTCYDARDQSALDIGASTGGFTDCLLQRGVRHVVAVDVGHEQMVSHLKLDSRVSCHEGINCKNEKELAALLGEQKFDLIVMDVSFISIILIMPNLISYLQTNGRLLTLVKPQFELGLEALNKKGIVKDQALYRELEVKISHFAQAQGLEVLDYFPSQLPGTDGNHEFFLFAKKKSS